MADQKITQASKWRPLRIVIPILGAELATALVVTILFFSSAGIFASSACQELAVIFCSIAVTAVILPIAMAVFVGVSIVLAHKWGVERKGVVIPLGLTADLLGLALIVYKPALWTIATLPIYLAFSIVIFVVWDWLFNMARIRKALRILCALLFFAVLLLLLFVL